MDPSCVVSQICAALTEGKRDAAAVIAAEQYGLRRISMAGRRYTERECVAVFARDGYIDRYTGARVVFPGTLRLLSRLLPIELPFHQNWKVEACHPMYWELFPTIDHVIPVSRGGLDEEANWVTSSMIRNSAKAHWTLEELNWRLVPPGKLAEWDGLSEWFFDFVKIHPAYLNDQYLRRWYAAGHQATNQPNSESCVTQQPSQDSR